MREAARLTASLGVLLTVSSITAHFSHVSTVLRGEDILNGSDPVVFLNDACHVDPLAKYRSPWYPPTLVVDEEFIDSRFLYLSPEERVVFFINRSCIIVSEEDKKGRPPPILHNSIAKTIGKQSREKGGLLQNLLYIIPPFSVALL